MEEGSPRHSSGSPNNLNASPRRRQQENTLEGGEESVKVCIRVRPFNRRELELHANQSSEEYLRSVVEMPDGTNGTVRMLERTAEGEYEPVEDFKFSRTFWSIPEEQQPHNSPVIGQEDVYNETGRVALVHALAGYNTCIFAYGQTGAGKTHTMMGDFHTTPEGEWGGDPGVIPRFCRELFARVEEAQAAVDPLIDVQFDIKLSAIEIYNETIRDLFWKNTPGRTKNTILRVRVHPTEGAFVDQLTVVNPVDWQDCVKLIAAGVAERTVAATLMNDESSRSHSLFMVTVTQKETVRLPTDHPDFRFHKPVTTMRVAHVNLVDLAGSERNKKSGAQGQQLKEAAGINQSLSTLKKVIDTLVANSREPNRKKHAVVPYRESTLTHLLSHSLGGNSKTTMVACVSPHNDNQEETVLTLRYANRAKGIVNHVRVNDNDHNRAAAALKEQIMALQQALASGPADPEEVEALRDQIEVGQQALQQLQSKAREAEEKALLLEEQVTKEKESRYAAAFYNSFKTLYLQQAKTNLDKRHKELQQEYEAKVASEKSLTEQLEVTTRQLREERARSREFHNSSVRAVEQVECLKHLTKKLAQRTSRLRVRLNAALAGRVAERWVQKTRGRIDRQDLVIELRDAKRDNEDYLRALVEDSAKQYETLATSYGTQETTYQQKLAQSNAKVHELEDELDALKKRHSQLQEQQHQRFRTEFARREADLMEEVSDLRKRLKTAEADCAGRLKEGEESLAIQMERTRKSLVTEHRQSLIQYREEAVAKQKELDAALTLAHKRLADMQETLKMTGQRERRYKDLAQQVETIIADYQHSLVSNTQKPVENPSSPAAADTEIKTAGTPLTKEVQELLSIMKSFSRTYRAFAPDVSLIHHHATETGAVRSATPPSIHQINVPERSFYPLLLHPDDPIFNPPQDTASASVPREQPGASALLASAAASVRRSSSRTLGSIGRTDSPRRVVPPHVSAPFSPNSGVGSPARRTPSGARTSVGPQVNSRSALAHPTFVNRRIARLEEESRTGSPARANSAQRGSPSPRRVITPRVKNVLF